MLSGQHGKHGHRNTVGEERAGVLGIAPGQPQLSDRLAGLWGWSASPLGSDAIRRNAAGRWWRFCCWLALVGGLFWYGLRTDWRVLYADLDPEDVRQAGQISHPGADSI